MNPLDLVKLSALMKITRGKPETTIGLIDGPVALNHSALAGKNIREISGTVSSGCAQANRVACMHGTFVTGILCADRNSPAPAICSDCTLLIRPIFTETISASNGMPYAAPEALAAAIVEIVEAGAQVINMSVALTQLSSKGERELEEALDYAMRHNVIVVAAGGNQGMIGSSTITRHQWVIPVVACDLQGKPFYYSNLGTSTGRRGLRAPGAEITSLGVEGEEVTLGGTSVAAPFVTGAIALLWSVFSTASAIEVKSAVLQSHPHQRTSIVPPLLNATTAHQVLAKARSYFT